MKRRRNNLAVRKSREKAKRRFEELKRNELQLEEANATLEAKIREMEMEIRRLREMHAFLRREMVLWMYFRALRNKHYLELIQISLKF